jgi:hypothetical protein
MSELSETRRVLHLVIEGFPADKLAELSVPAPGTADMTEIFQLTDSNAREALEKIFAADTVAVWSEVAITW